MVTGSKGHQTDDLAVPSKAKNMVMMPIAANSTDHLQPMDLSVNKAAEKFMCSRFRKWHAIQVLKQLDEGHNQFQQQLSGCLLAS